MVGYDRNKKKEFIKVAQFDLFYKEISERLNLTEMQT